MVLREFQEWLDRGQGSCWLKQSEVATIVESALRKFDGERYALGEFVIMPTHVHVLVTPLGEYDLPDIHNNRNYLQPPWLRWNYKTP